MKKAPTSTPRISGGKRAMDYGEFNEQHLQQKAMQSTLQTHQSNLQSSSSVKPNQQQSGLADQINKMKDKQSEVNPNAKPVGNFKQELKNLVVDPFKGIAKEGKTFFSIENFLGMKPNEDPETQQKKQQIWSRYQKLDNEYKQAIQKRFQKEMERKQRMEKEEQEAKQKEEEKAAQRDIQPPTSPKKGPVGFGFGNKKKAATSRLQHNRRAGLSKVAGKN